MTNIASQAAILGHNVKVLADGSKYFSSKFDNNQKFEIHRFDQLKFLRKKIKSNFANNLFKDNNFDKVFFDSWKSLESFDKNIPTKKSKRFTKLRSIAFQSCMTPWGYFRGVLRKFKTSPAMHRRF